MEDNIPVWCVPRETFWLLLGTGHLSQSLSMQQVEWCQSEDMRVFEKHKLRLLVWPRQTGYIIQGRLATVAGCLVTSADCLRFLFFLRSVKIWLRTALILSYLSDSCLEPVFYEAAYVLQEKPKPSSNARPGLSCQSPFSAPFQACFFVSFLFQKMIKYSQNTDHF